MVIVSVLFYPIFFFVSYFGYSFVIFYMFLAAGETLRMENGWDGIKFEGEPLRLKDGTEADNVDTV